MEMFRRDGWRGRKRERGNLRSSPVSATVGRVERAGRVFVASLIVITITVVALLAVRTVLVGGEVAGWDHSFHFTNSYITYFFFMAEGGPWGYDPWHMFGWTPNLYYNPGSTLFVVLTYKLTSFFMDIKSTYSFCVGLSYALLAPALAAFTYALTNSKLAAISAALIAVTVFNEENSWTDVGWRQVYYIGMWPQRWGLVTGISSLALLTLAFKGKRPVTFIAVSALFAAWSVLSHVMMGAATILFALILTTFEFTVGVKNRDPAPIIRALTLASVWLLWSLAIVASWAVPLLATNEKYHGLRTLTWELGVGVIGTILGSYPAYFNALTLLGPLIPLIRHEKRRTLHWFTYLAWCFFTSLTLYAWQVIPIDLLGTIAVLSFASALLLYSQVGRDPALFLLPAAASLMLWLATGPRTYVINLLGLKIDFSRLPLIDLLGYGKFAGYARYLLLAYFATVAASTAILVVNWAEKSEKEDRRLFVMLTLSMLVAGFYGPLLAGLTGNTDLFSSQGNKKFKFIEEFPLYANVTRFITTLHQIGLPANTYLLIQDLSDNFADWSLFCHNHFVYELPIYTGTPIVGGIVWTRYITQPISTTEYSRTFTVDNGYWASNVDKFYSQLEELGISYVAVFDPRLKLSLRESEFFEELISIPPYTLFRTKGFNPIITTDEGAEVRDVVIRPNLIKFTLLAKPFQTYEVRIRFVAFPGHVVYAQPEPLALDFLTFRPRVAEEVSTTWGYDVGSRIPFMRLIVTPLSESTVVEVRYNAGTWGDYVSLVSISLVVLAVTSPLWRKFLVVARVKRGWL